MTINPDGTFPSSLETDADNRLTTAGAPAAFATLQTAINTAMAAWRAANGTVDAGVFQSRVSVLGSRYGITIRPL